MDNLTAKEKFEYSWKHFALLADQRLRTFNFYVILLGASIGATIAYFQRIPNFKSLLLLGLWHVFAGLVFLLIDVRSRQLLEIPKNALLEFENGQDWPGLGLIKKENETRKYFCGLVTYSAAFWLTYLAQAAFGLYIVFVAILKYL